jgi:hypothetical protein
MVLEINVRVLPEIVGRSPDDPHSPEVMRSRDKDNMPEIIKTYILDLDTTFDYNGFAAPPSGSCRPLRFMRDLNLTPIHRVCEQRHRIVG